MASSLLLDLGALVAAQHAAGAGMKPTAPLHHLGRQRLAGDPLGTCTLELRACVAGSRYRVEVASSGALVVEGTVPGASGLADVALTVPYYAAGNANNSLRIKVRKATAAPKYKPYETQAVVAAAGAVVYVAQEADTIVS